MVSKRNRCSQLDTVPHPPPHTISCASTTNCLPLSTHTHTYTNTHTQILSVVKKKRRQSSQSRPRCKRAGVCCPQARCGPPTVHFPGQSQGCASPRLSKLLIQSAVTSPFVRCALLFLISKIVVSSLFAGMTKSSQVATRSFIFFHV